METSVSWDDNVRSKIAEKDAARVQGKAIVELSEDLEDVVKRVAGGIISDEIGRALGILEDAQARINETPHKNPRDYLLKVIAGISKRLTAVSFAYQAGSLSRSK
jgi:hypothetical protein